MEIFDIISGASSIIGLIVALIVFKKVNSIEQITRDNMNNNTQSNNTVHGDNAGRDVNK